MKGKGLRHFGEKLRRLRDEHDLSMYQMHIITGFARSTIWKWEQSKAFPSLYNLVQLAALFHVDVTYFQDETAELVLKEEMLREIQEMQTRIQRLENILKQTGSIE